jgi:hypothetical protein
MNYVLMCIGAFYRIKKSGRPILWHSSSGEKLNRLLYVHSLPTTENITMMIVATYI